MPVTEEDIDVLARAIRAVGDAISSPAAPAPDATGGVVASLTEAVMGVTAGLVQVAQALDGIADAIRSRAEDAG